MDTAKKLFDWANARADSTIKVFYVKKEQIDDTKLKLNERFSMSKRIVGTRQYHSFVPKDLKSIYIRKTSLSTAKKCVATSN